MCRSRNTGSTYLVCCPNVEEYDVNKGASCLHSKTWHVTSLEQSILSNNTARMHTHTPHTHTRYTCAHTRTHTHTHVHTNTCAHTHTCTHIHTHTHACKHTHTHRSNSKQLFFKTTCYFQLCGAYLC